jgi:hypothetical protein
MQQELECRFMAELDMQDVRLTPLVEQPGVPSTDTPR